MLSTTIYTLSRRSSDRLHASRRRDARSCSSALRLQPLNAVSRLFRPCLEHQSPSPNSLNRASYTARPISANRRFTVVLCSRYSRASAAPRTFALATSVALLIARPTMGALLQGNWTRPSAEYADSACRMGPPVLLPLPRPRKDVSLHIRNIFPFFPLFPSPFPNLFDI